MDQKPVNFQRSSTELVIASPTAGQYVTIAWPVENGLRVKPSEIEQWLRARGLHWPCFCSLEHSTKSRPAKVHESPVGRCTIVTCRSYPGGCGFRIDLNDIHKTARLESHYYKLPTLATKQVPLMTKLLPVLNTPEFRIAEGPYFEGYCGEHVSQYPLAYNERTQTAEERYREADRVFQRPASPVLSPLFKRHGAPDLHWSRPGQEACLEVADLGSTQCQTQSQFSSARTRIRRTSGRSNTGDDSSDANSSSADANNSVKDDNSNEDHEDEGDSDEGDSDEGDSDDEGDSNSDCLTRCDLCFQYFQVGFYYDNHLQKCWWSFNQ